jgi:hypothetical protein
LWLAGFAKLFAQKARMASKHENEDFGYGEPLGDRAQLALDTIAMKGTREIPLWMVHVMDMEFIEDFTGHARGDFRRDCQKVYLEFQHRCGVCMIDQFIPDNPLSMQPEGFASDAARSATTGIARIVRDGMEIDSPEAVVEHIERFEFPRLAENCNETPLPFCCSACGLASVSFLPREQQQMLSRKRNSKKCTPLCCFRVIRGKVVFLC